ncbi:MAG: carbohydrate kinase family protein [Patescibacteria group bacterium]
MFDIITIGTATRDVFLTSPLFSAKGGSAYGGKILKDPKYLKKIGFSTGEAQCFALGGKIEIGKPILTTGGGAGNAAVTFSRQGLKTAALVKLGQDGVAEDILKEFRKEKIVPFVVHEKNMATAYSVILLAPGGERTILVYRGASESLKIKEMHLSKMKTRWLYISPGKISLETISGIFDYFSKQKTLIIFSPSKYLIEMGIKKLKPFLAKSKAVILNREEAAYLTNSDYRDEKEIFKKLDKMVSGIAIMTDGPNGVLVSDGFNIYQAGILSVKGGKEKVVADRTGAGDAFGSGFAAGLMHKKEKCEKGLCQIDNIEYAIRLGSANAASVVEYIGAKEGILTKSEFEKNKIWGKLPIKVVKLR